MEKNESKQRTFETRAYKDVRSQIGISVVVDCIRHFLDTELDNNGVSGINMRRQKRLTLGRAKSMWMDARSEIGLVTAH